MNKYILSVILMLIFTVNSSPVFAQQSGDLYDELLREAGAENQGFNQDDNSGFDQGYPIQQIPVQQQVPTQQLKGRVVVAPAGSIFEARIGTGLSSSLNNVGDVVTATVSTPLVVGSSVVVPAGSQLIGQVTNVQSARRFMAGAGGLLEIAFTSVQTPDGQRIPLNAAVDTSQFKLQAETGGSRAAKTVGKAAVGAGVGALSGLVGAAISGGDKSKGAALGTAIGGGIGLTKAVVDKGREIEIPAGSPMPIRLQQPLQAVVPALP